MSLAGRLTVDLGAIRANWRALDRISGPAETAAVVKADAYGLGAARVGPALAAAGARIFFVAQAAEGAALRACLGPGPVIYVLAGFPVAPWPGRAPPPTPPPRGGGGAPGGGGVSGGGGRLARVLPDLRWRAPAHDR